MNSLTLDIIAIIVSSAAIFYAGEVFTRASNYIGDYFRMPHSVKGATLDAIASSFPELMVAMFAVITFKQFDVGIGTIAGSAFFNLLVIPGIAVLVAPVAFKISKDVFSRDAIFYMIAIFVLLSALLLAPKWGLGIALIFLAGYGWYIREAVRTTKNHVPNGDNDQELLESSTIGTEMTRGLLSLIAIGGAAYILTESAIHLAQALHVHELFIALTVIAIATSLPDAVVSIINARKGRIDDATSNVFGSNIFDIHVGLGLPLLLSVILTGQPANVSFEHTEIILTLLGATILTMYFMVEKLELKKYEAVMMLLIYGAFFAYIFTLI